MTKKQSDSPATPIPQELIERRIYVVRGQKVMLDSDLAELYQVTTGNLNLAVHRSCAPQQSPLSARFLVSPQR